MLKFFYLGRTAICCCFPVGTIVLLALALLGPAFNYIPSTALAAIIIVAVVPVVDVVIVWKIIRLKCK